MIVFLNLELWFLYKHSKSVFLQRNNIQIDYSMSNINNDRISEYLKSYIENPDPCYAILLKGKWGCGKSYFIDKWLENYKQPNYGKEDIVLEPIKISLYGLTEVDQITKAIDREMHPIIYSKGMEVTKKFLKLAGKIVLKTSIDFNNDNTDDATFSASLDSLSILKSKDKDNIKGVRFLVFDDIERCQIDIKQLLGYINYFVEHCSCHVIIIGDIEHCSDKETLNDFKEKTIGREFELLPDSESAVDCFIKEIPPMDWLEGQQGYITTVFETTQTHNLRILRQCLYDFKMQLGSIDYQLIKNDKSILKELLGCFIAVYCEYKGNNYELLKNWNRSYLNGLVSDENNTQQKRIKQLQNKYLPLQQLERVNALNSNYINKIVSHIEIGVSMDSFIEDILRNDQQPLEALDKLEQFYDMEDDEFNNTYQELIKQINSKSIPNIYKLGKACALLAYFDNKKIQSMPDDVIPCVKEIIKSNIVCITDKNELYKLRISFHQGQDIGIGNNTHSLIVDDINKYFNTEFNNHEKALQNNMEKALSFLNDNNIDSLFALDKETTPDNSRSYSLTPIFKNIDANTMVENIRGLSNKSIRVFAQFLSYHYNLSYNISGQNEFVEDAPILELIKSALEKEQISKTSISRYNYQYLIDTLSKAIARCKGEKKQLNTFQ